MHFLPLNLRAAKILLLDCYFLIQTELGLHLLDGSLVRGERSQTRTPSFPDLNK